MPDMTTAHPTHPQSTSANGIRSPLDAGKPSRPAWRVHLLVCLVYLLLALALTWPTVAHIATQLPGDGGDDPAIAWNFWWVNHALLDLKTNPLFTDFMFYPLGINLAFYTLTVLNALTALPLTLNLGVVAASNIHMLFTFVVAGYGTFLLARQELRKTTAAATWAAAVAGLVYAFASSRVFYVSLGQFNIASSHWIPYFVLFLIRTCRHPEPLRWPVLAAVFLLLQAWAEMTYASFLIIFTALYVLVCIVARLVGPNRTEACDSGSGAQQFAEWRWGDMARNLVLLGLLFAIGISPLLTAMLPAMLAEGDFWVEGTGFAEVFSADALGFLLPTMQHPWLGQLVTRSHLLAYDKGQHIFLGFTLLTLVAAGVWHGLKNGKAWQIRTIAFWLLSAIIFSWLCFGPSLHFNGTDTGIPGPFLLMQRLPFFKGNRYPSRYSVLLMLSLAIVAAFGVQAILKWLANSRQNSATKAACAAMLLGTLFVGEHLGIPLPQSDMAVPEVYQSLSAPDVQGTLLDIPFAWRNGFRITGPLHPGFMFGQFYQTVHQRPLLQGNTSRNPEATFQYFTEAPILNSLLALETGHQLPAGQIQADRRVAAEVMQFLDVTTIVVRSGEGASLPPNVVPETTIPYIETVLPVEKIASGQGIAVYTVDLPPLPSSVYIDANAPLARLHMAEGWGPIPDIQGKCTPTGYETDNFTKPPFSEGGERLLWAQRKTVRLLINTNGETGLLQWAAFAAGNDQRVTVHTRHWQSEPLALQPGWHEYAVHVPTGALPAGTANIYFDFATLYATNPFVSALDDACDFSIVVTSAGQEIGDFGRIYLDGSNVSPNERGYNVATILRPGHVRVERFDTHLDPNASPRLAAFLGELPPGCMVAVAVADEASLNLDETAVDALRLIGAQSDLRHKFRWSQAIIGTTGADSGSALEAESEVAPITISLGPAVTTPEVAAAFKWIRFDAD